MNRKKEILLQDIRAIRHNADELKSHISSIIDNDNLMIFDEAEDLIRKKIREYLKEEMI